MRLTILFDNLGPYHLARLQAASAGAEVVAVQTARQSAEYAWQSVIKTATFRVVTLFENQTSAQVTTRQLSARIASCLAQLRPEVVAIPGWSGRAAFVAMRWCLSNRVPVVAMSESTNWDEPRVAWKEWVKRRLLRLCSAALVGGRPQADYLVQLGIPRERIFPGYDAVDNRYFAAGAAEARNQQPEARRKHGLPENYFLASARFIEKKNLPRLLRAYARYRELLGNSEKLKAEILKYGSTENPTNPWDLVLLGDGTLRGELENLVSVLGLQSSVSLPGFKQYPELPTYYGLASAFIHASSTEQWGLVVNEAMASGLPVLVSNRCGCAADLVQEGLNGFTFDPYEVEELAQLMLKLSAFSFLLSDFGNTSRQIIANWGPERFATGLKLAVDKAVQVGAQPVTWVDLLLLQGLLCR